MMRQTTLFQNNVQRLKPKFVQVNECDTPKESDYPVLSKIVYKETKNDFFELDGFDKTKTDWIYPINKPVRNYQLHIVQECLFKNVLVCLPTGLGKTFIATVVMYNFYRWYPNGKLIFVAPTRPLVRQQMLACSDCVPIDNSDVIEMTGSINCSNRKDLWRKKRVFYLTAQVLVNDLDSKICPGNEIVTLVFDEAHKATKNHPYCQIVRLLTGHKYNHRQFRLLGLSATPGSDLETIQEVIQNLLVTQIELRTDECADVKKYSHDRLIEEIVIPIGAEVSDMRERILGICEPIVNRLRVSKAIKENSLLSNLTKFGLLQQKEQYKELTGGSACRNVLHDFALVISLYHGVELVVQHGLRSLLHFLTNSIANSTTMPHMLTLMRNPQFVAIYNDLESKFHGQSFVCGHPKLKKVEEIIRNHFEKFKKESSDNPEETRAIVFSQFRDSVEEIFCLLEQLTPLIRPVMFLGKTGKTTQRDQFDVMQKFIKGECNVLVSTCVGEEGIDIGEVDLIICFDAQRSPIRLVQRSGRTGRKREGRIVMLLSEGKEVNSYHASIKKKSQIHSAIFKGYKCLKFYPENARMVPLGINPIVSYQKLILPKKMTIESKTKKIKVSNQLSADCFSQKQNLKSTINFVNVKPGHLRFLSEIVTDHTPTFSTRYRTRRYRRSLYQTQNAGIIGHSVLTENIISVLKLKEMHCRKQTNLIFHLSSSRIIDVNESFTELDGDFISEHSLSSFSLSLSDCVENEDDDITDQENLPSLINVNKSTFIRTLDKPNPTSMSDEKFQYLMNWLESSKPDILSDLNSTVDQLKNFHLTSEKSEPELVHSGKNDSEDFDFDFDMFTEEIYDNDDCKVNLKSSDGKANEVVVLSKDIQCSLNSKRESPKSVKCTSNSVLHVLLSSFSRVENSNKATTSTPLPEKNKSSLLCSFQKETSPIDNHNDPLETQIGLESILNFLNDSATCEISEDLFGDNDDDQGFAFANNPAKPMTVAANNDHKFKMISPLNSANSSVLLTSFHLEGNSKHCHFDSDEDLFPKILEKAALDHSKMNKINTSSIISTNIPNSRKSSSLLSSFHLNSSKISSVNKEIQIKGQSTDSDEDLFPDCNISKFHGVDESDEEELDEIERNPTKTNDKNIDVFSSDESDSFLNMKNPKNFQQRSFSESPSFGSSNLSDEEKTEVKENKKEVNEMIIENDIGFVDSTTFHKSSFNVHQKLAPSVRQPSRKDDVRDYFLSQAAVAMSSSDDDDDGDEVSASYDASFIDDDDLDDFIDTQLHGVYMQSIRSPKVAKVAAKSVIGNQNLKEQSFLMNNNCSELVSSDDEYMLDSFVVADNYVSPVSKRQKRTRLQAMNSSSDNSPVYTSKKFKRLFTS